ncbi:DUF1684 domain-containing protein [Allomuricauda sp. d1]|uniref:DUF1684 domain-containing protein n=1 Tax=Allomuricauda sp. d1 TaxID=3136725 RepID=UPI0031E3739B
MYTIGFAVVVLLACKQGKHYHDEVQKMESSISEIASIVQWQTDLNETFKNPETSPLPDRFRKDFRGLDFFPPDTSYIVKARIKRTPDAEPFLMPTTTDKKSREVVFGIVHFWLNGREHQLEVYQNLDGGPIQRRRLFLPFYDETNGEETYGGGRYIDLAIPKEDSIIIDFNKAYNPYCVYNKKYSCPLVPRQNYLRTNVRAGVKDFQSD